MEQTKYSEIGTTIAAISTPQAPGGIGVVRISGPNACKIADRVFLSLHKKKLGDLGGYSALYGKVCDENGPIDEAVALKFRAPKSFTGEEVVELSCHGGLVILRRLLRAVIRAGAVPAGPGEFTRRAFLNGKIGLTEAESVMQLVSAQGEQAAKAALAGHEGALERRIQKIRETLLRAAAHLSAWVDYPEDDIPRVTESELRSSLGAVQSELEALLRGFDAGLVLREGVNTVIAGRPNAGKSTLMNLLAGCERSIVTSFAGTTRDIVEDTVLLGGIPLRLADTAGLRDTADPIEQVGVGRARNRIRCARLVLAVFDASQELNEEDRALLREVGHTPCVAVINKVDLPEKIDKEFIKSSIKHTVYLSAKTGQGLPQLEDAVAQVLGTKELDPSDGMLYTERQRDAANRSLQSVNEALGALQSGMTFDAVTVSVEDAVSALLELTGERATVAVVDSVFSHFCVGK
ncbi:MAG: tRNA uridine-5-carboxymethylaminomethyl(34) synthesis GTPase MnmE [Oscillospiraceae bacterium]|jgi:tRNA modification GTPase|nr:tRNA uridine-5-carboxymethylaminomethyl(34) synthesis GTPase MnmE [Oscillospiraceae bacterium]